MTIIFVINSVFVFISIVLSMWAFINSLSRYGTSSILMMIVSGVFAVAASIQMLITVLLMKG